MDKFTLDNITIEYLNERINDLRDVLNELCCTDSDTKVEEEEILNISRNLDILIVEYMREIGK